MSTSIEPGTSNVVVKSGDQQFKIPCKTPEEAKQVAEQVSIAEKKYNEEKGQVPVENPIAKATPPAEVGKKIDTTA